MESGAGYLAATFFIVLGAINIAHNLMTLLRGAAGTWWPVLLGCGLFGLGPLLFGAWLAWKQGERKPDLAPVDSDSAEQKKTV